MRLRRSPPRRAAGFTYVALMIAVAIIGLVAASAVQVGSLLQRRVAEEALLDTGRQFAAALDSYAKKTPTGQPTTPATLQDLLKDPRFPGVVRHLRKLYVDPMTGDPNWGIVKTVDGQRILGLYSLSTARPIKVSHFESAFRQFEGATSYANWVFTQPPALDSTPVVPNAPNAPPSAAGLANGAGP